MKITISISYFHRKIGPINAYTYPESVLEDDLSVRIANIMDQTFNEGFFTHSFENLYSMNYYFEIPSEWARGNKEMLMVSVIFDQQTTIEIEQKVERFLSEFAIMLQSNEEIYAAYYINDLSNYDEFKSEIIENDELMKVFMKDLYRTIKEDTREKSEEEVIAFLLSNNHIFLTLKKLSEGPIILESLSEWFHDTFIHKNFEEMIDILVDKQFIFKNKIGWTTYILLLREVSAERIPPLSVIENFDNENELNDLLLPRILEYFNELENKTEEEVDNDAYQIFQIISDPKKYNILSKLRSGWIPKEKLGEIVPKRNLDSLMKTIEFLSNHSFIEEIEFNSEICIVLKTNFQIKTDFPKYLRQLLKGKETAPIIADRYDPNPETLERVGRQKKGEEVAELFKETRNRVDQHPKERKIQSFLTELSSNPKKDTLKDQKENDK